MNKLKIGLLPFYIKLYDDHWPELREKVDAFHQTIVNEFKKKDIEVVTTQICRIQPEFEEAIWSFEKAEVDALVTLHLAYSPSLESVGALAETDLPIAILDTTPDYDFSPTQSSDAILYNHGIHGVQDLCNLLIRNGKDFMIEAGHWKESNVLDRIIDHVKSVKLVNSMKSAKVGKFGEAFAGMGDFAIPEDVLRSTIGIETISLNLQGESNLFATVTEAQIENEKEQDQLNFHWGCIDEDLYRQVTHDCLTIRNIITVNKLTAFTMSFLEVSKQSSIRSMPFLEASKAMCRGIGYAGEGDVLTAALVGSLLSVYPDASFTEMFCPDWKNDSVFLSHMGEMNLRVVDETPMLEEMDFPFTDANNTIVAYGRFRGGDAVYVCLSPGKNDTYSLILSEGKMLDVEGEDKMKTSIHGWFKPTIPIGEFLSIFSKHGGIHHGVIVYGDVLHVMKQFGVMMGWDVVVIGENN